MPKSIRQCQLHGTFLQALSFVGTSFARGYASQASCRGSAGLAPSANARAAPRSRSVGRNARQPIGVRVEALTDVTSAPGRSERGQTTSPVAEKAEKHRRARKQAGD